MAICKLNDNWLRNTSCGYNLGSITMIYAINSSDLSYTTVDTTDGQEVTGITLFPGARVYQLEPARNSASWSDTLVANDDGTKHRTHLAVFNLLGSYSKEQADVVDAIALGKYTVVVQKADGGYVMLGRLNGLEATVATIGGSEDNSVPNGLQVSMEANQAEVALPLSSDAVEQLLSKRRALVSVELDDSVNDDVYGFQMVYGDTPKGDVRATIYELRGVHVPANITWDGEQWSAEGSAMADKIAAINDYGTYFDVLFAEPEVANANVVVGTADGIEYIYAMV